MNSTFQNLVLPVKIEVGTPRYLSTCKVGHIGVCFLLVCFSTARDLGIIEKRFNVLVSRHFGPCPRIS